MMAYNEHLADRIREYLAQHNFTIQEKKMFGGLAFIVNGKMCINVSGENLMCRYHQSLQEIVAEKKGYLPMIMKGKELDGYCYVSPDGFRSNKDFEYWVNICLDFNKQAKSSKKKT